MAQPVIKHGTSIEIEAISGLLSNWSCCTYMV
jgi:hypothetical protein